MQIQIDLEDLGVIGQLHELQRRAQNLKPVMEKIANLGEAEIRESFNSETAPDGTKWQPSQRVLQHGGKTLTKSGDLEGSKSSFFDGQSAIWGVGKIYGAIHQFGGTIQKKSKKTLAFTGNDGHLVFANSTSIPARPFLPTSLDQLDPDAIINIIQTHLTINPNTQK